MRTPTFELRLVAGAFLCVVAALAIWSAGAGVASAEVSLVPCPVRAALGLPCPGCGMTRACVALARGEVVAAWGLHPFAFLLVPLALAAALVPGALRRRWTALPSVARAAIPALGLVLALGAWGLRVG